MKHDYSYTFSDLGYHSMTDLRKIRKKLRDELAGEIQKYDAIKAEILWLQEELKRYRYIPEDEK